MSLINSKLCKFEINNVIFFSIISVNTINILHPCHANEYKTSNAGQLANV